MIQIGKQAKQAATQLAKLSSEQKNRTLLALADALIEQTNTIIKANTIDCIEGRNMGLSEPLIDRLTLTPSRIQQIADSLRDIAQLEDPIGEVQESKTLPNGLFMKKVTVPLGVIGIIYESRPNVTLDAFALTFKTGNAVILKGGKEAIKSNIALESIIQKTLVSMDLDPFCVQVIKATDRETTRALMQLSDYVDVLIPRGSASLIKTVIQQSTIPVLETGAGNCHIYIDESCDEAMALRIIKNAKLQRLGVCNALESVVIHEAILPRILPKIVAEMPTVTFLGDTKACSVVSSILPATDEDYYTEYLDLKLSCKTVASLDEAIEHINTHNTKHSDAILTDNPAHAEQFLNDVDAACVYVNASTRFTDGYEMGFGAEIGISTQKLHARGPMGLKALTSYKYKMYGNGQTRES